MLNLLLLLFWPWNSLHASNFTNHEAAEDSQKPDIKDRDSIETLYKCCLSVSPKRKSACLLVLSLSWNANSIISRKLFKALAHNRKKSDLRKYHRIKTCSSSIPAVSLSHEVLGHSELALSFVVFWRWASSPQKKILEGKYIGKQAAFFCWCIEDSSMI